MSYPSQSGEKQLRKALRISNAVSILSITALGALILTGFNGNGYQDKIRTKQIVVEDADGNARIIIAAPLPDDLIGIVRQQETSGIALLNADGHEQFGLGINEDGSIAMGMDAAPGIGDDRNRERITFSVNSEGNPQIRMLDNYTRVTTSLWSSDDGGQVAFYDWTPMEDGKTDFVGFMSYGKESGYTRNK